MNKYHHNLYIWQPKEDAKKIIKNGFMRIYTYKPVIQEQRELILHRHYDFSSHFGSRECDFVMDIPKVPETKEDLIKQQNFIKKIKAADKLIEQLLGHKKHHESDADAVDEFVKKYPADWLY